MITFVSFFHSFAPAHALLHIQFQPVQTIKENRLYFDSFVLSFVFPLGRYRDCAPVSSSVNPSVRPTVTPSSEFSHGYVVKRMKKVKQLTRTYDTVLRSAQKDVTPHIIAIYPFS